MERSCVFCDRSQFEERLIFENREWNVIATLGQITDGGYVLIVPREQVPCMGAFDLRTHSQIGSLLRVGHEVIRAVSIEYQNSFVRKPYPVTLFEHGIVGQTIKHAHLHVLPAVIDFTPKVRIDFPKAKIQELKYAAHLQALYQDNPRPYLFWTTPSGKGTVCWNPAALSQCLRIVAAEFLGRLERANWRNMDPELDKRLWQETVQRLKPYFRHRPL
ncbi:MAG: HIT domain-containing protein [Candidatus Sungbacteria bacterium]|nr:HIT domain-containing protein [Candidatus Sungbacteria bacterium]